MATGSIWECGNEDEENDISGLSNVNIRQGNLNIPVQTLIKFEHLGLHKDLLRGLHQEGLWKPRHVQHCVLPLLFLSPDNVVVRAPAKSGKTTAALIKAVSVATDTRNPRAKVVLVHPTRDNARRAVAQAQKLGQFCRLSVHLAVRDGESKTKRRGELLTDRLLVGTPEKLRNYIDKKYVAADEVKLVVLDDVDTGTSGSGSQMALSRMLEVFPLKTQRILLSSLPWNESCDNFVASTMSYAVYAEFPPEAHRRFVGLKQYFLECSSFKQRMESLIRLLSVRASEQTVIVCDSKDCVTDVHGELKSNGFKFLAFLHGKVKSSDKDIILELFKSGKNKILVTTPPYLESVVFHSKKNATLVNFHIQVARGNLDHDVYHKRANILNGIPGGLAVNMIDERWAGYTRDEYGQKLELQKPSNLKEYLMKLQHQSAVSYE